MGANSILIEQARRFTLLVGNYSREKFNHPGPAFLYVQAWGESLFWAAAARRARGLERAAHRALPAQRAVRRAAWSRSATGLDRVCARGRCPLAALLGLFGGAAPGRCSARTGCRTCTCRSWPSWCRSPPWPRGGPAGRLDRGAVRLVPHPRARCLPVLRAPCCGCGCLVAARLCRAAGRCWRRRWPRAGSGGCWLPVAWSSARVFALPIAVELALHWPGNFGQYFAYSGSANRAATQPAQVARYVLWFWWPHRPAAWAGPGRRLALVAARADLAAAGQARCAGSASRCSPSTRSRRSRSLVYAVGGVDALDPTRYYIGYFYWSAPADHGPRRVFALAEPAARARRPGRVTGRGGGGAAPPWPGRVRRLRGRPADPADTNHADPANPRRPGRSRTRRCRPASPDRRADRRAGHVVLLPFQHNAWPAITGILVQAERTGVRACVADPDWEFMLTSQFICTPAELAGGRRFSLYLPGQRPARNAGGVPASAGHSDSTAPWERSLGRGQANIRARERVRRYVHLPGTAAAVAG